MPLRHHCALAPPEARLHPDVRQPPAAASFCASALPPRTSATRGSIAPARAMITWLSWFIARLTSSPAAAALAPIELLLRTSATRGSMAPACTMVTRLLLDDARAASAPAACSCATSLPTRTSATNGLIAPACTIFTMLSVLLTARSRSMKAACSCASVLPLRNSATTAPVLMRLPMAPAFTVDPAVVSCAPVAIASMKCRTSSIWAVW
eukprot:scaffold124767_cov63-Phaeocystis_antarctica.AAC.1